MEECNRTFNLDFLDDKVKEPYVFKPNSTEVKYDGHVKTIFYK